METRYYEYEELIENQNKKLEEVKQEVKNAKKEIEALIKKEISQLKDGQEDILQALKQLNHKLDKELKQEIFLLRTFLIQIAKGIYQLLPDKSLALNNLYLALRKVEAIDNAVYADEFDEKAYKKAIADFQESYKQIANAVNVSKIQNDKEKKGSKAEVGKEEIEKIFERLQKKIEQGNQEVYDEVVKFIQQAHDSIVDFIGDTTNDGILSIKKFLLYLQKIAEEFDEEFSKRGYEAFRDIREIRHMVDKIDTQTKRSY